MNYVTKEEFDNIVRLMEESRVLMEKSKLAVLLEDKVALKRAAKEAHRLALEYGNG